MIHFDEDKQNRKINDLLKREEEELVQLLSAKYGIEYVDLLVNPINTDALRLIDEKTARGNKMAAFSLVDKKVKVAVRNPEDQKVEEIKKNLLNKGYEPTIYICSMISLEKAWNTYKDLSFAYENKAGSLDIASDEISAIIEKASNLPTIISILKNTLAMKKSYRVSRILETILAGALATEASDVHIEPEEEYIRLRYRLDGVLVNVLDFDKDTFALLLSRIKLLSGLKLNIKKDAQDGRFSVHVKNTDIEIRTSILPGAYNESIVMRVLNPKSIGVPMEELGIPKKLLQIIQKEIVRPNGMLLTTGPTGSGKTTTLYAFLKKVHNPTVKIITIEDPIEYHLPGIVQTQTNDKGYTFLEGLRSALRQDPDIIMVGEIRDSETAAIAINSSLTGHLVFSTLHTNSAAGAFPRLIDLGINSKIMSSAINIVLAQRLVRKLCEYCKKPAPIEGSAKMEIEKILGTIFDKSEIPTMPANIFTHSGCEKCNQTGYKGRIGIYEGIKLNPEISNIIDMNPSEAEIEKGAASQGILTLKQDGILKVLAGITSLDELERVISIED
ncbi:MAG TPA: GspE/PulE family protein [Candidatus Paceibacterota bacterium]